MPTNFGYQGFQSWGMMTQPAMKPGETTETRASKFADVGHGVVYRNAPVSENLRDDTVTKMAFATVKASDYTVPDRRGISTLFSKGLPEPKKFLGKSMHHTSFEHPQTACGAYAELTEPEIAASFDALDATGCGELPIALVKPCLVKACGGACPPHILDKFGKYFEHYPDGGTTLDGLLEAHAVVRAGALPPHLGGVQLVSGAPEWLISSRAVNTSIVPRDVRSSYQKDLGKAGEGPQQRTWIAKTGMKSTTDDLFEGTTKDTYHIPGYCGHIAASKRNPDVLLHSEAETARENSTSLRLYHRHNVPGYTGHQPTNARNDLGERLSGAHPATTSGAAALGLVL